MICNELLLSCDGANLLGILPAGRLRSLLNPWTSQPASDLLPVATASMSDPNLSSFIWSVADLLRGDYKQSDYGKVILPFTVLRRLDCVLEPTKAALSEVEPDLAA
jgi:hypothetical protein